MNLERPPEARPRAIRGTSLRSAPGAFKATNTLLRDLSKPDVNPAARINEELLTWAPLIDLAALAADGGWKNAPTPTPPPDLVSRLRPNADPEKEGDLAAVMDAVKDQPKKVKEWAKEYYGYATGLEMRNFYDPAKVALTCTERQILDPFGHPVGDMRDPDFKRCVFRPNLERYAYDRANRVLSMSVPANRLEKVARLAAHIYADRVMADPANPDSHLMDSMQEARAMADKPERNGSKNMAQQESAATKSARPTPSPSPLPVRHRTPEIQMEDLGAMPPKPDAIAVSDDGLHVAGHLSGRRQGD